MAKKDEAFRKYTSQAMEVCLRRAKISGLVRDVEGLVRLGVYSRAEVDEGRIDLRNAKALINALNIGIRDQNYSSFFKALDLKTEFYQHGTTAFQDKYDEILPHARGKFRNLLSVGEKALTMYGLKLDAKHGKSGIDKALSSESSKAGLTDVLQLLSAFAYSHRLHDQVGPSVNYLEMMQKTLLKTYKEKDEEGLCEIKDKYLGSTSPFVSSGIEALEILNYINGARVSSKLDFCGEIDSDIQYDMTKIHKRDLTNVGMLSVQKAAMQVHSVVAKPFFMKKLGLTNAPVNYEETNPEVDPFLSFYKGESKDDVIGEGGRWTKYATMINTVFNENFIKIKYGKPDFSWDSWMGKIGETGEKYKIEDVKAKFLEALIDEGAMAVSSEKEFALIATKVMVSPEMTKMFDPAKVFEKHNATCFVPDPLHPERTIEKDVDCVAAKVFTHDNIYTVQRTHVDHTTGGFVRESFGVTSDFIVSSTGEVIETILSDGTIVNEKKVKDDAISDVAYSNPGANLREAKVVIGSNPIADCFQEIFDVEQQKEDKEEKNDGFQGRLLVKDLQAYQAAFRSYSEAVKEFI